MLANQHVRDLGKSAIARLFGVSRSLFYGPTDDPDVAVRDEIYAIAADWPQYGYRTITHELQRRGLLVNSKRVRRIMREESLLCRRRRSRGLPYRKHGFGVYPNLARGLKPTRIDRSGSRTSRTCVCSELSSS